MIFILSTWESQGKSEYLHFIKEEAETQILSDLLMVIQHFCSIIWMWLPGFQNEVQFLLGSLTPLSVWVYQSCTWRDGRSEPALSWGKGAPRASIPEGLLPAFLPLSVRLTWWGLGSWGWKWGRRIRKGHRFWVGIHVDSGVMADSVHWTFASLLFS